ncbi:hypothetical protein B9Z55_000700 [Caenorhabditis nigoni]|uniref:F-box domain-containing protein n=1 Tax=Caenorhabditis nigoni TaxID=1611254 RepID=A0A2G5VUU4_9PELO|nr:hypothetical protein B9Z55_000700 [Caenorhabditis nigoni]
MKLSNYPLLIQKEILHNMKYTDLFLLSFVSKNMKKLIKSSQTKRFRSIDSIVYDYRDNQPLVFMHFGNFPNMILEIAEWEKTKYDYFQLNVSGKIIDFRRVTMSNEL